MKYRLLFFFQVLFFLFVSCGAAQTGNDALFSVVKHDAILSWYNNALLNQSSSTVLSGDMEEFRTIVKEHMKTSAYAIDVMQEPMYATVMQNFLLAPDVEALSVPMNRYFLLNQLMLERSSTLLLLLVFIISILAVAMLVALYVYIARERKYEELKKISDAKSLSYEVAVKVQEDERCRVYKALHDTVLQDIQSTLQDVPVLKANCAAADKDIAKVLDDIERRQRRSVQKIGAIIRSIMPPVFEQEAYSTAVEEWCKSFEMDNNIHCLCKVDVDEETVFQKLPGTSKLNLFRIMQEALVNAAKHADAQEVSVLFRTEKNGAKHVLELSVTDDGIGFDVDSVSKMEILLNHTGILSMKSRAAAMGGTFSIISSDSGTEISVKVPL